MQVNPIKPNLKPPGTKRLKLGYDGLLSNFGFKFNLRRYTGAGGGAARSQPLLHDDARPGGTRGGARAPGPRHALRSVSRGGNSRQRETAARGGGRAPQCYSPLSLNPINPKP